MLANVCIYCDLEIAESDVCCDSGYQANSDYLDMIEHIDPICRRCCGPHNRIVKEYELCD